MRDRYLEVTFRKGRVLAAYLHLPRALGVISTRSERVAPGVVADYGPDGALIGFEVPRPRHQTGETHAVVYRTLGAAGIVGSSAREEVAPLASAA